MALESDFVARVEAVIRSLSTAGRSLRLYPPSSPIPRESAEALLRTLQEIFDEGEPVLSLSLARDGFICLGEPVGSHVMGVQQLVGELTAHGVAELDFLPGCSADELTTFLSISATSPEEVRSQGGISLLLTASGVNSIRVTDVQLTVLEAPGPSAEEDIDDFLRALAQDPEKLATWFAAASAGDPRAFEESLMELVRACGPEGHESMLSALSSAFMMQKPESKDALLGLALEKGATRDLTGAMFSLLTSNDIAGAVLSGTFGKNMLSLSAALTQLPLDRVTAEVRARVQALLPTTEHTDREAQFLEHMIEVRERAEPEPELADADGTYRSALSAIALSEETIAQARGAVAASYRAVTGASVRTMLVLLGQQTDKQLFVSTIDSLAGMVPRLAEQGDLALAAQVLSELSRREASNSGPAAELAENLRAAIRAAADGRTMQAVLRIVIEKPERLDEALSVVRNAGDAAPSVLAAEAISLKSPGLHAAEQLLGRRSIELLSQQALQAQWFNLAPVAALLAASDETRAAQTLEALLRRPDEQSRREVVTGLAQASGPAAARLLAAALRDPSPEVVMAAARAMSQSPHPDSASVIVARLGELDIDNSDFAVGRELIAALARMPGPVADDALARLASRRAILKRGHFVEIQTLVSQALAYRSQTGGTA